MPFSVSDLKYIDPPVLRSWIESGRSVTGAGKFAVIDVRDSDYTGGHIVDSLHYASRSLQSTMPKLIKEVENGLYNDVVFHCMQSQQRGPAAAMKFMRKVDESKIESGELRVWILRGGFIGWQQAYAEDAAATEGYLKELWEI